MIINGSIICLLIPSILIHFHVKNTVSSATKIWQTDCGSKLARSVFRARTSNAQMAHKCTSLDCLVSFRLALTFNSFTLTIHLGTLCKCSIVLDVFACSCSISCPLQATGDAGEHARMLSRSNGATFFITQQCRAANLIESKVRLRKDNWILLERHSRLQWHGSFSAAQAWPKRTSRKMAHKSR